MFLFAVEEHSDADFRQSRSPALLQLHACTAFPEHLEWSECLIELFLSKQLIRAQIAESVIWVSWLIQLIAQETAQKLNCPVEIQLEPFERVLWALQVHYHCAVVFCVIQINNLGLVSGFWCTGLVWFGLLDSWFVFYCKNSSVNNTKIFKRVLFSLVSR